MGRGQHRFKISDVDSFQPDCAGPAMDTKHKSETVSTPSCIPTYAERHAVFNRLVERNPWIKIYVAVILLAEAAGGYLYAVSKGLDVDVLLGRLGLFGMLGAIFLVFLPFILIRLNELYAGKSSQ
jgi:hypothetical protein